MHLDYEADAYSISGAIYSDPETIRPYFETAFAILEIKILFLLVRGWRVGIIINNIHTYMYTHIYI